MPRVPNIDRAIVAPEKLTKYLLNPAHPVGGPKARFFMRFGFDPSRPGELTNALLSLARSNDYVDLQLTPNGTKYKVTGELICPDGRKPTTLTVWIVDDGASVPRLVTAYPA